MADEKTFVSPDVIPPESLHPTELMQPQRVDAPASATHARPPEAVVQPETVSDPLRAAVIRALQTVYDPEIPVNVYDLGLIYHIDISDTGMVAIQMTLTTPGCPVAHTFPTMIENAVRQAEGVDSVAVMLIWDPPWTQARMSEAAQLQLGLL